MHASTASRRHVREKVAILVIYDHTAAGHDSSMVVRVTVNEAEECDDAMVESTQCQCQVVLWVDVENPIVCSACQCCWVHRGLYMISWC